MGYGHLRAAHAVAAVTALPLVYADEPPIADAGDARAWARARAAYERISRTSQLPVVGAPFRAVLDGLTAIPHLHPDRDLSRPHLGVRILHRAIERGLGTGLVRELRAHRAGLVTTFYAPALVADHHGIDDILCIVTDADVNRIWAPREPRETRIRYAAPTQRVQRRLIAYGVPPDRIEVTGFPLPVALLGDHTLHLARDHLARRLVRLDPTGAFLDEHGRDIEQLLGRALPERVVNEPLHIVFAIGGAGAQTALVGPLVRGVKPGILRGELRLTLVAGIRPRVRDHLFDALAHAGLAARLGAGVEVLYTPLLTDYLQQFNAVLARADVLWTKPSELTFFGALGLPLVLAPPMGVHERYNRRWARECGVAVTQRELGHASEWLSELARDGTLAAAAWSGFIRMPKSGLFRIAERLARAPTVVRMVTPASETA